MTDAPAPLIKQKQRRSLSFIWLVPLIAAIAGGVLLVRNYRAQGPELLISLETATGVSAGKTEIRYKEVVVGKVTDVQLGSDDNVLVTVSLRNSATRLAVADSRFWVVRPRFDTSGISGLSTLLSGAYIGVDAGVSQQRQHRFIGLESPPPVAKSEKGSRFKLIGSELGSLDIGSPVYYRHLEAGQVATTNSMIKASKFHWNYLSGHPSTHSLIAKPASGTPAVSTSLWQAAVCHWKLSRSLQYCSAALPSVTHPTWTTAR